jgi:hypothetical protein
MNALNDSADPFQSIRMGYDPGEADAREYILRCEEARLQLQQTD